MVIKPVIPALTPEAKAGRLPQVPGQTGLQGACSVSQKQKKRTALVVVVEVECVGGGGVLPDLAWLNEAVLEA